MPDTDGFSSCPSQRSEGPDFGNHCPDSPPASRLALFLKRLRLHASLSPEVCVWLLGVKESQYEEMEAGSSEPSLPQLELLSRLYNVPLTHFLDVYGDDWTPAGLSPSPQQYLAVRRKMIGILLRQARNEAGLNLDECAAHMEIPEETLNAYERGIVDIPLSSLLSLSHFLQTPLSSFAEDPCQVSDHADRHDANLAQERRELCDDPTLEPYSRLIHLMRQLDASLLRQVGEELRNLPD